MDILNVLLSPSKSYTIIDFGSNDTIFGADGNVEEEFSEVEALLMGGEELLAGDRGKEKFCEEFITTSSANIMTLKSCAFFRSLFSFLLISSAMFLAIFTNYNNEFKILSMLIAHAKSTCFNHFSFMKV